METELERRRDTTIDARRAEEATCVAKQWAKLTSSKQVKVTQGVHGFGLESIAPIKARIPLYLHGLLVRTGRDWADADSVWTVTAEELALKLGCSVLGPIALIQSGCEHCANINFKISRANPNILYCVARRAIDVGDTLCAEYSLGFPDATCISCQKVAIRHTEEGHGRLHRGDIPQGWSRTTRNCEKDGMPRSYYWRWDMQRSNGNEEAARGIKLQWELPTAVGSC